MTRLRRILGGWRHPTRAVAMALAAFSLSWGVALGEAPAGLHQALQRADPSAEDIPAAWTFAAPSPGS